jgi:hypothetical protein
MSERVRRRRQADSCATCAGDVMRRFVEGQDRAADAVSRMSGGLDRRGQSCSRHRRVRRRTRSGRSWVYRGCPGGDRAAFVSPLGAAEAVHLPLPQSGSVEPSRQEKPATDIVPKRNPNEKFSSRSALALGHRKRCRHDVTAGMGLGLRLEVVILVSVREHAVGQRSIHGRCSDVCGHQRRA